MVSKKISSYFLYIAWFQALVATFTSLYFSEVFHFPPCVLCWYQRIAMYPLAIILAVIILKKDKNVGLLVLPFSIVGMCIALFHSLLEQGIISEKTAPCIQGISCTTKYIEYFGFITIPFLSLIAFTIITICAILYIKLGKKS